MKIVKHNILSGWTRPVGIGITALALAVTFSLPTSVAAKEKKFASKVTVHKKSNKKISKPKALIKNTNKTNKTNKVSKFTKKSAAKTTKATQTSHSKTASKKHNKSAVKRVSYQPKQHASSLVWNRSKDSKQAYYVMPTAFEGNVGKPQQQPEYLQPSTDSVQKSPEAGKVHQIGTASYYSDKFDGHRTASGERFDQDNLTCAHGSLPFGCRIRVTNLRNNKAVEVKVNDRGGFSKQGGRVVDLSKAAAKEIGMMGTGTAKVKVEVLQ
ncbi:septal ring lytic transglycosylase RlpA family protein [Thiothrix lacustris]|uniref:septal ring lytic transglycosylase RlpA family protein n=1 Tax=Thiothrix lacustris TaxID=525917 RepID=UPI0027E4F574|nr:septal ring lytic transglycosylase RlpA family protein [Thiothrix lacustris]WMP16093.1 septal ring lytic transglycosylase RlpA family protein [Thiothrix lacustris]